MAPKVPERDTAATAGSPESEARFAETLSPAFDAFATTYAGGAAQVVWTRLIADLETPVSAYLKLAGKRPSRCAPGGR